MNTGKLVFAQVMDFLPLHEFRKCVKRYQGDYKVKDFSCLDQFLCRTFAQLIYRSSLRDIETFGVSTFLTNSTFPVVVSGDCLKLFREWIEPFLS